ncbi:uncharacterized protein LOC117100453, partial [Anneissia japonica]|uniref:uncharacterized protein LOC117100453 n=1 Tax=Anneissia japonica TaxID=1529436 RepID=UPI001425AA7E
YGVFTKTDFQKGDFLLEYAGEHITAEEGDKREREANYTSSQGSFLFFYGKNCVDATFAESRLGRFVNDEVSKKANSVMKKIDVDGKQHLCLFAKCDICAGTELRYDYGVPNLPWRKMTEVVSSKIICSSSITGTDIDEHSLLKEIAFWLNDETKRVSESFDSDCDDPNDDKYESDESYSDSDLSIVIPVTNPVSIDRSSQLKNQTKEHNVLEKQISCVKSTKKNLKRRCPFCGIFQAKLSRNINFKAQRHPRNCKCYESS